MHRSTLPVALALALGGASAISCVQVSYYLNPNHCSGAQDGDTFCGEQYPDGSKPYCRWGSNPCNPDAESDFDGCVVERPDDECYSPCGQGKDFAEDMSCLDDETTVADESSTGSSETSSTGIDPDTGTGTDDPTTGPSGCMSNEECTDAELPFCNPDGDCVSCEAMAEPDTACAEADAALPVCDAGTCVQCTADNAAACEGSTPVCGAENTCEGCTEHSQCPDSACHLDGDQAGACFDVADVQQIANTAALETALGAVGSDDSAVLVLAGGTYSTTIDVSSDAEVAILGNGQPVLAGDGSRAVDVFGNGLLYLAGVQVVNGSGDGLSCSGSAAWLDDSEVRNNAQVGLDVSGGCEAHLRRTVVRANNGGGLAVNGASATLETSSLSVNLGANPGLQVINGSLEASYSTIVGNFASGGTPDTLQCTNPSGFVRNSIVLGEGSSSIAGCGAMSWENNAVDTTGLGASNSDVGAWDSSWFSATEGDFSLTPAGQTEFMDIAQWAEGDPLTDFEGDAIPTDAPSFPGYDQ